MSAAEPAAPKFMDYRGTVANKTKQTIIPAHRMQPLCNTSDVEIHLTVVKVLQLASTNVRHAVM